MTTPVSSKKIILVANTGWYLYNFRLSLAQGLRDSGMEPVFVSPRDIFSEKLVALGFRWRELALKRASLNPLQALLSILGLVVVYWSERPNLVHHFTPKCVFFGTVAAKLCRIRAIVNSVTGLGHLAEDPRWYFRTIFEAEKVLYGLALKRKNLKVILQNPDDYAALLHLGLIREEDCRLIRGSGVDTARFVPHCMAPEDREATAVLFASRLLEAKGIYELVDAARIVKARYPRTRFWIAGDRDLGNPTSVSAETVEEWKLEGAVEMLGHQDPIDNWIARATIVVLPSYREGLPKILLEASAMEKPIVTTDTPGCREVVKDGETGFMVPVRNAVALANALCRLLADEGLRKNMGIAGRKKVLEEFSAEQVVRETIGVYRSLVDVGG